MHLSTRSLDLQHTCRLLHPERVPECATPLLCHSNAVDEHSNLESGRPSRKDQHPIPIKLAFISWISAGHLLGSSAQIAGGIWCTDARLCQSRAAAWSRAGAVSLLGLTSAFQIGCRSWRVRVRRSALRFIHACVYPWFRIGSALFRIVTHQHCVFLFATACISTLIIINIITWRKHGTRTGGLL